MGSTGTTHARGTKLWFNAAKKLGSLRAEEGYRVRVPAAAFASGEAPVARCAGRAVEFSSTGGVVIGGQSSPESSPRRPRR